MFGRILALAMLLLPQAAFASYDGFRDSAILNASAELVRPISIETVDQLGFGVVQGGDTDGYVRITPDGDLLTAGGAQSIDQTEARAAKFNVFGDANRAYSISTPTAVYAGELVVYNLQVVSRVSGLTSGSAVLDSNGRDELRVGGDLMVPAGTPRGTYVATVAITVAYQ
jgi:Domain of unknown function (DUF4402)